MSTKNIVPRTTHEGSIGRTDKRWGAGYIDNLTSTKVSATNVQTTGTATFGGNTTVQGTLNTTGGITSQGTVSGSSGSFTGSVSGGSGNFSGNLTVGGTLNLQGAQQFFFLALSRLKAYKVGDIAFPASAPSWVRLECVQAGTTSVTEPEDYAEITEGGGLITDGTCVFIVDDTRDGNPVGTIIQSLCTKVGYLTLNGQTVTTTNYPRLTKWVQDNNLTSGNKPFNISATSLTLPNYAGKFFQNSNDDVAKVVNAGLPNITANGLPELCYFLPSPPSVGQEGGNGFKRYTAFGDANAAQIMNYTGTNGGWYNSTASFDASRSNPIYGNSNTVQPPAVKLLTLIKY